MIIMSLAYIKKRKVIKTAREVLRHARHLRNMREDLLAEKDMAKYAAAESRLAEVVGKSSSSIEEIESVANAMYELICEFTPNRVFPGLRENLEVLVVAVAVAMAVKAYFLQPFKIPTGSMEPTLYGINIDENYIPGIMDKKPLNYVKWILTGNMYKNIVVSSSGQMGHWYDTSMDDNRNPVYKFTKIGDKKYKIPEKAVARFQTGEFVPAGSVLWSGLMKAGDHVFVDKMSWNFRRPRRGEIMVFKTSGIKDITRGSHYIKRLVGLPGEKISVDEPNIVINGENISQPHQITRIMAKTPPYTNGYVYAWRFSYPDFIYKIPDTGFMAFGDNSASSFDSRAWGPVPQENMMGPALFVYWPFFNQHWGIANR